MTLAPPLFGGAGAEGHFFVPKTGQPKLIATSPWCST